MIHDRGAEGPAAASKPSERDRFLGAAIAVGIGLGVFSVLADGAVPWRALVILGNIISPWAVAAFAVGRPCSSNRRGAWGGTVALLVGVATYYVGQALRFGVVTAGVATGYAFSAAPLIWLVVAVTVGPVLGAAGSASKWREPVPVAAIALPCVVLFAEAGFLLLDRRPWLWNLSLETYRLIDLAIMVGLVVLGFAIPAWAATDRRRRLLVYGVSLLVGAAGSVVLVGFYRLLVHMA